MIPLYTKKTCFYIPSCSNILSHSSKIKCLMCFRFKTLSRANAKILPGVPTTIFGQLVFKTCSSFFTLRPPKNTATLIFDRYLEKRSYSLLTWKASSRVCDITRTLTWPSTGSNCWRVANTNTAVFPIPLFAWQTMSIPRIAWGIHSCWTKKWKIQFKLEAHSSPQTSHYKAGSTYRIFLRQELNRQEKQLGMHMCVKCIKWVENFLFCSVLKKVGLSSTFSICSAQKLEEQVWSTNQIS